MDDATPARDESTALPQAPSADQPSLRSWLAQLDAAGELKRVGAKVDWDEEIGAIARVNLSLGGPALLFERIKGYEDARCTQFFTVGWASDGRLR